jgi:hypothetical protein
MTTFWIEHGRKYLKMLSRDQENDFRYLKFSSWFRVTEVFGRIFKRSLISYIALGKRS